MLGFPYCVTYFAYLLIKKIKEKCTENIGNRVKQSENLKKKLKDVNNMLFPNNSC